MTAFSHNEIEKIRRGSLAMDSRRVALQHAGRDLRAIPMKESRPYHLNNRQCWKFSSENNLTRRV